MTHQEIQEGEIVERYVRHQLAPDERLVFQEHFFACEECFEQVQGMAGFVASVHQASRQEGFGESLAPPVAWWAALFKPAFGFALLAILLLIIALGWFRFRQSSTPSPQFANQQQPSSSPEQAVAPDPNPAPGALPVPENKAPAKPPGNSDLIAENRPPVEAPGKSPVVLLESARDAGANSNHLRLQPNVSSAVLQLEVEPGSPFTSFQFQVFDGARRLVTTATSGKASRGGVVAVRVAVQQLQDGKYLIKCYGVKDGQRELIGEYDLRVSKS